MSFPRYERYKDSGVEWFGEVPEHWDIKSMKSILVERKEKNDPIKTKYILSLTMDKGVIPYSERDGGGNKAKEDLTAYKLAYPNDIVLNSMNVVVGSVGLSKYFGAVSPVYYMLYPRKEEDNVEYFNYIFQSETFQKSLLGLGNGILMKESESSNKLNTIRMRIPMEKLNVQVLPYPSKYEQKIIVSFLNRETTKIDELISEQQMLIELLKEKRQAIISHVVTKGLNPDVPMKDSGVEWLGEVPEHWDLKRLKQICSIFPSNVDKKAYENESPVLLCNYTDVYHNEQIIPQIEFMAATASANQITKFTLRKGDTIITKDSETADDIAIAAYVPLDLPGVICGYHLSMVRPREATCGAFVKRLFDSIYVKSCCAVSANGLTRVGLNQYALDNLEIPLPPRMEQEIIATFLDRETTKIDELISEVQQAIELLKERRTALISAAVTGKIDVRRVAA